MEIYVDADACPVKEEVLKVSYRHDLVVHLVSNAWLRLPVGDNVKKVVVGDAFDAADDWIAENVGEDDIVVTGDIPLAKRCLDRGAKAIDAKRTTSAVPSVDAVTSEPTRARISSGISARPEMRRSPPRRRAAC